MLQGWDRQPSDPELGQSSRGIVEFTGVRQQEMETERRQGPEQVQMQARAWPSPRS